MAAKLVMLAALLLVAAHTAAGYPALGGYMPVSSVLEHSQISKDVFEFGEALKGDSPNYELAEHIFKEGGGNSCKSTVQARTLQAFATKDLAGESFYDAFIGAGFPAGWWDTEMLSALQGTGVFEGASRTKRVTCLTKGAMGLVTMYASHELEAAIVKAEKVGTRIDSKSGHAWDEGWAFYYGADAGANSPFEVATKRDGDFPDGTQVSTSIDGHFNKGLIAVRKDTYDDDAAKAARDTIYKMWAVTYLRAALKYLQISETTYSDKAHAEGYAYFMAIDGWVHSKNAKAATTMRNKLKITQTSIPEGSYCEAKKALEDAYEAMGLSCDIMGTFKDESITSCPCSSSSSATFPDGSDAVSAVAGDSSTDVTCEVSLPDSSKDVSSARMMQLLSSPTLALVTMMAARP